MDPLQEQKVALPPEGKVKLRRQFRRFFADLGTGLITGADDDDPSGISTYSVTAPPLVMDHCGRRSSLSS
jgi:hypothetical protein